MVLDFDFALVVDMYTSLFCVVRCHLPTTGKKYYFTIHLFAL